MKKILLTILAALTLATTAHANGTRDYYEYVGDDLVVVDTYNFTLAPDRQNIVFTNVCNDGGWNLDWLQLGPCWDTWQIVDKDYYLDRFNLHPDLNRFIWSIYTPIPSHITIIGDWP